MAIVNSGATTAPPTACVFVYRRYGNGPYTHLRYADGCIVASKGGGDYRRMKGGAQFAGLTVLFSRTELFHL